MTSFATHRLRVHDAALPAHRRMSALRTCLTEFAPYGFRATFHHLRGSAGIPRDPARDPDALVRAVEELRGARELWLAALRPWQEARRFQKRAGIRVPDPAEPPGRVSGRPTIPAWRGCAPCGGGPCGAATRSGTGPAR